MIRIENEEWPLLSFPDANIMNMEIETNNLEISVDTGYLDTPFNLMLGQGCIKFLHCQKITIRSYNPASKSWYENTDILKDLCEVEINENVKLKGFGKSSGHWTEFTLTKPSIKSAVFSYAT